MRRILGGLAALTLSFAGLLGSALPADAHSSSKPAIAPYAALGDSFAAGYGLPGKTDPASQLCARSNLAYPELLNGFHRLSDLDFLACSGSTTTDVLTDQVPGLDAATRVVTLTIGGNDVGFSQLACLQTGCDLQQLVAAVTPALEALGGGKEVVGPSGEPVQSLVSVLAAIKARAPRAHIFITGYPELFGTRATVFGTRTACPVSEGNRVVVNTLTRKLNAVIKGSAAAARAHGMNVTFVGVAKAFDGHGICDTRVPFISTVLHPTLLGQATYAGVLIRRGVTR